MATRKCSAPDLVGVLVRKRFVGYGVYDGVVEHLSTSVAGSVATVRWTDGSATTMTCNSVMKCRLNDPNEELAKLAAKHAKLAAKQQSRLEADEGARRGSTMRLEVDRLVVLLGH